MNKMDCREIIPGVLYYPSFIEGPDEVLNEIREQVDFTQRSRHFYGKVVKTPRLEAWYGDISYRFGGSELPAKKLPPILESLANQAMEAIPNSEFKSCLANLYRDGKDYVSWHADDEPEMGDPIIASISLGSERDFLMKPKPESEISSNNISIRLAHGSMLVMLRGIQFDWLHSIPKRAKAGERINLTFRDCRK